MIFHKRDYNRWEIEGAWKGTWWKQPRNVPKTVADHNYHEEGGESIAMVQKRNIEALNEILSDNTDKDIVIGTHGTALVRYWIFMTIILDVKIF